MSTFQLTLATEEGGITTTTVKLTDRVTTLSTTIENAFRIPASQQELYHDGNLVPATHTFFSAGIIDGDLLLIKQNVLTVPPITPTTSPTPTPLDHILQNPAFMSQLKVQNPLLWQRVLLRCPNVLNDVVQWIQQSAPTSLLPQDSAPAPALPTAPSRTIDPMSVEGQRAIEERIRHENVMENMEAALEHNPEAFGRVVMLFVDCKINTMSGIKAFVDRYVTNAHFRKLRTHFKKNNNKKSPSPKHKPTDALTILTIPRTFSTFCYGTAVRKQP